MPYTFGTSITAPFAWQDSSMWTVLIAAVNERLSAIPLAALTAVAGALNPGGLRAVAPADTYTSVAVGTNEQYTSWFNSLFSDLTNPYTVDPVYFLTGFRNPASPIDPLYFGLQAGILAAYPWFCDHTIYYEANAADLFLTIPFNGTYNNHGPAAAWTLPQLRMAAGLPTTLTYDTEGDPSSATTPNIAFRRPRSRENTYVAAPTD